MTQTELKKLIDAGDIDHISFFNTHTTEGAAPCWEIWAYDYENETTVASFGNCLKNSTRKGSAKTYTSLDRAYIAIRQMGYVGKIEIDG